MYRVRDITTQFEMGCLYQTPAPKDQGSVWKRIGKLVRVSDVDKHKETVSSAHKTTNAQRDSQRLRQHTRPAQGSWPDVGPAEKGKWTQSPTPMKKLSAIDTCWERESQYCPMECHFVY